MTFTKMKRQLLSIVALALLALPFALAQPQTTYASVSGSKDAACDGVGLTGADCGDATSTKKVDNLLETIVNLLSLVVGIAAVIMIIFAGFKYITSGGESSNVSGAKNTLIYAIVGLIIVALAQVIVRFVIGSVK